MKSTNEECSCQGTPSRGYGKKGKCRVDYSEVVNKLFGRKTLKINRDDSKEGFSEVIARKDLCTEILQQKKEKIIQ